MPKQPNDFLKRLNLAAACLQQVRQQLIRCEPSSPEAAEAKLACVVGLLRTLNGYSWNQTEKQAARKLLAEVREGAARAQVLLDSAASFHCGIALAGPAVPETYTPDGGWQANYPTDQICLNA